MEFKRTWTDDYLIHSYESDKSTRATPIALLQFMQESAWNHAEHLQLGFTHLSQKGLAWILARLSLKITQLPRWHKKIILETWPSGLERLFAYRDFRISSEDKKELAIGSTSWITIDVERRRPQKTDTYLNLQTSDAERVFPQFTGKIPAISDIDSVSHRKVYFSYLDVNGHVNNVKYLEFVIDSLPFDFLNDHHLELLEINFLAEALYDDIIEIKTQRTSDLSFVHSIQRQHEGDELCRLKTSWVKV